MSKLSSELIGLSATEQAAAIKRKDISSSELVDVYLARIAAQNHEWNAYTYVSKRRSRWAAKKPHGNSALAGVPTAIKDLNPVRGMPTRFGSRSMRYFVSPVDDPVSRRIKGGGLPILGKLATSELGHLPVTEPLIHAPTRNPRARDRSAGGSSGGSAAAVAAGLTPVAHGSDGAGSIRIPAAFCGLIGFKPSREMIVSNPKKVDVFLLTVNGPIARTVDDAAALLGLLALDAKRNAYTVRHELPRKLKVRVSYQTGIAEVDPEHQAQTARVAKWFKDAGHEVEERPWFTGTLDEFLPVWQRFMFRLTVPRPSLMMKSLQWLRSGGQSLDTRQVGILKKQIEQRIDTWAEDADVWISPTVPRSAPLIGEAASLDGEGMFRKLADFGAFTAVYNISGQPAATVPAGTHSNGCPIGVQIATRRSEDGLLLEILRRMEAEQVWQRPTPTA
jgi:amidase